MVVIEQDNKVDQNAIPSNATAAGNNATDGFETASEADLVSDGGDIGQEQKNCEKPEEGKYEIAIKECTKALELNPGNVKALVRRGEAHEKLEHFKETIAENRRSPEMAGADNFQNLTEDILIDILSHLTSPEAAATSVLSKSWNGLFKKTCSLRFDGELNSLNVIQNHLVGRDQIKKCFLILKDVVPMDYDRITELLTKIFQKHMAIEYLSIDAFRWLRLPKSFSLLCFLVQLKLNGISIGFLCPKNFLPFLKKMELKQIQFSNKEISLTFLLCSYVLEELNLDGVEYTFITHVEPPFESFPKLVKAVLCGRWESLFAISSLDNTQSLQADLFLKHPSYHPLKKEFINLTDLSLFISNAYFGWVANFLSFCPKLHRLNIQFDYQKHKAHIKDVVWDEGDLSESPRFGLGYGQEINLWEEREWKNPLTVPTCLTSSLKYLIFKNFAGRDMELNFVEYMMRKSGRLTMVDFHLSPLLRIRTKKILVSLLKKLYGHYYSFQCFD